MGYKATRGKLEVMNPTCYFPKTARLQYRQQQNLNEYPQMAPVLLGNPEACKPLNNPSVQVMFHVLVHFALLYCGNVPFFFLFFEDYVAISVHTLLLGNPVSYI